MRLVCVCLLLWATIHMSNGVSTKMDYDDEGSTSVVTNSSNVNNDDVEVKHTIVVTTKLRNNNRKGLNSHGDGDTGTLTYNIGQKSNNDDTNDVPVVNGFKAVETTRIRTPDSRQKSKIYPESIFVSRNIRDGYDVYPNVAANPMQWKPASFYNNINWRNPDNDRASYNGERKRPNYQTPGKLNRKITEDGMREFYCRKCRELGNGQAFKGCTSTIVQRVANPWTYETTTPKIKIDGKLAKLN